MLELLVVGALSCAVAYGAWYLSSAKKRERERAEVQERFSGLYNSSKDAMGFAGFDGKLLDVNDSFCRLTGYSREELLTGRRNQDITPKESEEYEAKIIEGILRTGKPAEYEKEYIRKDGSRVPTLSTTFVVKGADCKPMGLAAIIKDITERKRLHEKASLLATVVTDSNDAVTLQNLDGSIAAWNKGAKRMYGYSEDEALGMNIAKIVPADKRQENLDLVEKIKTGELVESFETQRLTKDGCVLDVWLTFTKLVDDKGNVVAVATTERDITERKRLQEKMLKSERLTAIGQLAATVGHEIRNPLGVISNSSYFLNRKLKDVGDEKVKKHLRIIERKVDSANLIVRDLLDFARKKTPTLKQTDLNDIVTSALSNIPIPENIKVTTKLGEIPPMPLDQEQITRAFQNIILNAVQAMPKGGRLTIQTSKHDKSARITFKDTGAGIPKENLPKMVTPLFSTKAKGVGLGLTICNQIVEGHGGNITAKSKVGKGSTFTVKLPIHVKKEG